jgi:hypothetical protein
MFSRKKELLKRNVALLPLVLLLNAFGFHLESDGGGRRNKICNLIHMTSFIIVLFAMGVAIYNNIDYVNDDVVLSAIYCINCTCIYFTLIIISFHNMFLFAFDDYSDENKKDGDDARVSLWKVFECFNNIDVAMCAIFSSTSSSSSAVANAINYNFSAVREHSRTILLLLISVLASVSVFIVEYFNHKNFLINLIFALLAFVLCVKISLYCLLVHNIKARIEFLNEYLRDIKSNCVETDNNFSHNGTMKTANTKLLLVVINVRQLSQFRNMSLIYDEMVEIISLLNNSFSALLSSAFSKYTFLLFLFSFL